MPLRRQLDSTTWEGGGRCYKGSEQSCVEASAAMIALATTSNVTCNQVVRQEFYCIQ